MTCRHGAYDSQCSSYRSQVESLKTDYARVLGGGAPDSKNFEIDDFLEVGKHLVLRVKYPNCASCAYEGCKIMVILNASARDALKWREIDPHFRATGSTVARAAPSPAARFPASDEGWHDAVCYAQYKLTSAEERGKAAMVLRDVDLDVATSERAYA